MANSSSTGRELLDQRRAAHALKAVKRVANEPPSLQSDYVRRVQSLGAAILTNGLGQAAATYRAAGAGSQAVYNDLSDWLCHGSHYAPFQEHDDLLQAICDADRAQYMRAVSESLAWVTWLKKFAVAYLHREGSEA
jgi:CRISPR-associated protein Cmr5